MKNLLLSGLLLASASAFAGGTGGEEAPKDSTAQKYAETIKAADLNKHLTIIASDEFEGRETGMKGQKLAQEYIVKHFKSLGIPASKNGTYLQEFKLSVKSPQGVNIVNGNSTYKFLEDFFFYGGFDDQVIKRKEVVFLGYGIDDEKYNDYEGVDVKDKIVVVFDKEPTDKGLKSHVTGEMKKSTWTKNWRAKSEAAQKHGAAALLIMVDGMDKKLNRVKAFLGSPSMQLMDEKKDKEPGRVPMLYISTEMGQEMIAASGKDLKKIKKKINKKGKPVHLTAATDIALNIERQTQIFTSSNVMGFIEGSDLKDEIVVITAHYDHIGRNETDVFNGADDDGSGTVAALELAEAFAKAKAEGNGPRRSVLVMTVSGEEKGLLGSSYYVDHPIYPLENTVVDLNIDMIGRLDKKHADNPDYVYLIGSDKLSTELHAISEQMNSTYSGLDLDYTYNDPKDPNRFYYRSDHYNFAKNNIPIIFYFNGTHEDYHQATDTVEKINFDKMEKITRLVFHTAWNIANRDKKLVVDVEPEKGK